MTIFFFECRLYDPSHSYSHFTIQQDAPTLSQAALLVETFTTGVRLLSDGWTVHIEGVHPVNLSGPPTFQIASESFYGWAQEKRRQYHNGKDAAVLSSHTI